MSKQLRGDIDNIALMALRKEPTRRYASANDLHEDIQRHLENIPVHARNDSVWYRTTKFVARHKAVVAASALVLVALLAGFIVTLHEARVAQNERARAERRFNDVRELANSLMFEVHDSIRDLPGTLPARKLLVIVPGSIWTVCRRRRAETPICSANWRRLTTGLETFSGIQAQPISGTTQERCRATKKHCPYESRPLLPTRTIVRCNSICSMTTSG